MSYTPGTGGRVQVAVPDGSTVSVTITALSGAGITVYSDVDRTSTVSMPDAATVPTTYYVDTDDTYQVSCLVGGVECAVQGSTTGVVTVDLWGDTTCSIGVDSEFAQNSGGGGGASVPSPTTGDAGKVVTVNGDEDGYELDLPGGSGLPIAEAAGWTVDESTYTNPSDGQPMVTLVGSNDDPYFGYQAAFALAYAGDAFPRIVFDGNAIHMGDGTVDPVSGDYGVLLFGGGTLSVASPGSLELGASGEIHLDPAGGSAAVVSGPLNVVNDLTFLDPAAGPVINDQSDGHTYRIISTVGVLSTEQVS